MDLAELFGKVGPETGFILAIGSAATFVLSNFNQYIEEIEDFNGQELPPETKAMYHFHMTALRESIKPVADKVVTSVETATLESELEGKHEKDT